MADISAKIVELITQLQGVVKDNAADAVNLGLSSIRIDSIRAIVLGIFFLILFIIGIYITKKVYNIKEIQESYTKKENWGSAFILSCFLTAIALILSIITLLNIWCYVAIFNPKLYLAHEIMNKFFN